MSSLDLVKIYRATFNKTTDGKETIRGVVHSIRDIPTKTGTKKVLVSVGNVICKIFAEKAEEFIQKQINYEGKEAEFCGRWDVSRPGRKEFIIEAATCKPEPKAEPLRAPQKYEFVAIIDPTTGGTIGIKRIPVPVQSRHAHLIECCSQFSTKYLEAGLSNPNTPQEYRDAYTAILQSRKQIVDVAEPLGPAELNKEPGE